MGHGQESALLQCETCGQAQRVWLNQCTTCTDPEINGWKAEIKELEDQLEKEHKLMLVKVAAANNENGAKLQAIARTQAVEAERDVLIGDLANCKCWNAGIGENEDPQCLPELPCPPCKARKTQGIKYRHRWSGWPGAYCLKCGAGHAQEIALADGWYDPVEDTWDTEEHKKLVYDADGNCPVPDKEKQK